MNEADDAETTHGEPMNEADDAETTHGEPMNEADDEVTTHGEPMNEADDEVTTHGEPMNEADDEVTTHGEPMNEAANEETAREPHETPTPADEDESMADTQRSPDLHDTTQDALAAVASELGHDEVRVLTRIAERLKGGRAVYGPLRLDTDDRQFRTKAAREELEDALVYLTCAWLKTEEVTR